MSIELEFRSHLIKRGYSTITPSGHPSTVYDYCRRIKSVCEIENITWEALAAQIDTKVRDYDCGGIRAKEGEKSHRAVINALKAYQDFTNSRSQFSIFQ